MIYIAIIAVLLIVAGLAIKQMEQFKRENNQKEAIIAEQADSLKYHRNERGHLIAEKIAVQAHADDLEKAYPKLAQELHDELDLKFKQIKSLVQAGFQAQGSGNSTVIHNHYDSAGSSYPFWQLKASDGYMNFQADIYDSLHAPYKYNYRDTITTTVAFRKKWLFGKEQLFSSSYLKNPNAKVTNSTSLLIDSYRDKRYGLGVGIGYDPLTNKPVINAGVYFLILKF